MDTPVVELTNVSFSKRDTDILKGVNFALYPRDYVGLIGPNGGGKTTLLRIVLGLLSPTEGTVKVLGENPKRVRGKVGYVPQFSRFDPEFPVSVIETVLMGRVNKRGLGRRFRKEDYERASECLAQVGMQDFEDRRIGGLSGGELQRVLIARALVLEPEVLLLDEPTASVDTPFGEALYELLSRINKQLAIILVSHDVGVLSSQVKTIACLNKRLHYHQSKDISEETLESVYGCPVDLIAHGHAHRVLHQHEE